MLDGIVAERTLNKHFDMLDSQSQELGGVSQASVGVLVHEDLEHTESLGIVGQLHIVGGQGGADVLETLLVEAGDALL